jgi:hypothetical protein
VPVGSDTGPQSLASPWKPPPHFLLHTDFHKVLLDFTAIAKNQFRSIMTSLCVVHSDNETVHYFGLVVHTDLTDVKNHCGLTFSLVPVPLFLLASVALRYLL